MLIILKFLVGWLALAGLVKGQTFSSNGYRDLVVSIHPDIQTDQHQLIIDNLKVRLATGLGELWLRHLVLEWDGAKEDFIRLSWVRISELSKRYEGACLAQR